MLAGDGKWVMRGETEMSVESKKKERKHNGEVLYQRNFLNSHPKESEF